MNSPTPLFFYALYASPFVVAVLVLALSKVLEWRASRVAETIEKPITVPEAPVTDEVRTVSMRRHYVSFAATH